MKKGWSSIMDRRVKERLIGATILVALIVLIVPELLSGPKRQSAPSSSTAGAAEPMRNVTVDLATSKATAASGASASAADAASAPAMPGDAESPPTRGGSDAPGATDAAGRRTGTPPTITTLQAQQPVIPPLENEAPSPKSTPATPKSGPSTEPAPADGAHHHWSVQLGSFASSANAESLQRRLRAQSYPAYISATGAGRSLRYRVRVGPMADRGAAEKVIARLKNDGHSASIVAP